MNRVFAKKVVITFAEVTFNGCDYKVWENGAVEKWVVSDDNVDGFWSCMSDCDYGYDEIKEAGLQVLV